MKPARNYRDILKNRMENPAAMRWWMVAVRIPVLDRDGWRCRSCGSTKWLQIHHLTYKHLGSEDKHLEDCITLCKWCHEKADAERKKKRKKWW